jgi:hypothetical protein
MWSVLQRRRRARKAQKLARILTELDGRAQAARPRARRRATTLSFSR